MQKILMNFLVIFFTVFVICLNNANAVVDDDLSKTYYDFGVFAYEDGDLNAAEQNFINALKIDPNNSSCNHYLGKTYLKKANLKDARIYLEKAWKTEPNLPELKYDLAFLSYQEGNFQEASKLFVEISKEDKANILANYYAGISLMKQENYKDAIDYFTQTIQKSPNIADNSSYYAGICHFKLKNKEESKKMFEYVRDNTKSQELKNGALQWLNAINRDLKDFPISIYTKNGYKYDDNVKLEPIDKDLYQDKADSLFFSYSSINYNFSKNNLSLGLGYNHYVTLYSKLSEYNLTGSIGDLRMSYYLEPLTLGIYYNPSYYWLDSKRYLFRSQVGSFINWKIDEKFNSKFNYSFYRDKYFDNDFKNGQTHELGLDFSYKINDYLGLNIGLGYEKGCFDDITQYDNQIGASVGLLVNLPYGIDLNISGKYQVRDYEDFIINNEKREDTRFVGFLSVSKSVFFDWLSISGEYNYTKNNSNISDYEYQRNTIGLFFNIAY